jgi:hypothetical protein
MKTTFWLILIGLAFVLGYCTGQRNVDPCPEITADTVRTADTVYLQERVTKKPYRPIPKLKPAGKLAADTNTVSAEPPAVYVYEDSLIDENLGIYITDTTAGPILGRQINYTLKIPLHIKETITVTKTAEVPVLQNGLFIGLEAGWGQGGSRVAPEVSYLNRKGWICSYNYDLLNKVHSGGIKKRLL